MEVTLLGPNVALKMCMLLAKERQIKVMKFFDPDLTLKLTIFLSIIAVATCYYYGAYGLLVAYCLSCLIRWRKNEIIDGEEFIEKCLTNEERMELANEVMKPVPRGGAEENFAALSLFDKRYIVDLIGKFINRTGWNVMVLESPRFPDSWEENFIHKKAETISTLEH